jgi:hypothetical protein
MAIAANDVNVLTVETPDQDFRAGQNIQVTVEAEAGVALHGTGGQYRVRMTMTDRTNPSLLNQQDAVGNYGDASWPNPGLNTFTFTVPGAATAGRAGDIVEPQARIISNAAPPFDSSHTVGETVLLTP